MISQEADLKDLRFWQDETLGTSFYARESWFSGFILPDLVCLAHAHIGRLPACLFGGALAHGLARGAEALSAS